MPVDQLRMMAAGQATAAAWGAGCTQVMQQLAKPRVYQAGEPAETARFSEAPAFLAGANLVMRQRVAAVDALRQEIRQIG